MYHEPAYVCLTELWVCVCVYACVHVCARATRLLKRSRRCLLSLRCYVSASPLYLCFHLSQRGIRYLSFISRLDSLVSCVGNPLRSTSCAEIITANLQLHLGVARGDVRPRGNMCCWMEYPENDYTNVRGSRGQNDRTVGDNLGVSRQILVATRTPINSPLRFVKPIWYIEYNSTNNVQ